MTWKSAVFSGSRRAYVYPIAGFAHAAASIGGFSASACPGCFGYLRLPGLRGARCWPQTASRHRRQQLVQRDGGEAGGAIAHGIRKHELVAVQQGPAGVDDVGHIALAASAIRARAACLWSIPDGGCKQSSAPTAVFMTQTLLGLAQVISLAISDSAISCHCDSQVIVVKPSRTSYKPMMATSR